MGDAVIPTPYPAPAPGEVPYVRIPGWDDIIHVMPKAKVSKEEAKEYYAAKREGRASFLSPEKRDVIEKRRQRAIDLRNSPTPDLAKTVSKVLTFLDDTQDALTTLGVVGRVVARVAPRLVPYVGAVMLASDVINLASFVGRTLTMGRGMKKKTWDWAEISPFGAKSKMKRAARLKRVLPTIGEMCEILQTTDQLWGVGVCLGPIMGFVQDSAWNILKGGEWKRQTISPAGDKAMIGRGTYGATNCMRCHQDFSLDDHVDMAVVLNGSVHTFPDMWDIESQYAGKLDDLKRPMLCPDPYDPCTIVILEEEGFEVGVDTGWPLPGNPIDVTLEELATYLASESPSANTTVAGEFGANDYQKFYCSAMRDMVESMTAAVEQDSEVFECRPREEMLVVMRMQERGFLAPAGVSEERLGRFIDAVAYDYTAIGSIALNAENMRLRANEFMGGYRQL